MNGGKLAEIREEINQRQYAFDLAKERLDDAKARYVEEAIKDSPPANPAGFATH